MELAKEVNKPVDECKKAKIVIVFQTGKVEDEEKMWNRKRCVHTIEIVTYFGTYCHEMKLNSTRVQRYSFHLNDM